MEVEERKRNENARSRLIALSLNMMTVPAVMAQSLPKPPEAKAAPFTETLHGDEISDPYRWMEAQDEEYQLWLKAQGLYARDFFDKLPRRQAVHAPQDYRFREYPPLRAR